MELWVLIRSLAQGPTNIGLSLVSLGGWFLPIGPMLGAYTIIVLRRSSVRYLLSDHSRTATSS